VECVARDAPRILTAAAASIGIASVLLTTACYTYDVQAPADLLAGQHVEVVVNNVGRVALTADLGEDVSQVDGDIVAVSDSALSVRVMEVEYLNGSTTPYPGSSISIRRESIRTVSTKQFSRSKTAVVAVGLAALLIGIFSALGIAGLGGSSPDPKPVTGGSSSQ
ncbi:MAG: hypothetical protein M3R65_11190, partial [Gemmatimonadota bacterium]|nr:hypothetical protein [Gemmatimonadota bacterium]